MRRNRWPMCRGWYAGATGTFHLLAGLGYMYYSIKRREAGDAAAATPASHILRGAIGCCD